MQQFPKRTTIKHFPPHQTQYTTTAYLEQGIAHIVEGELYVDTPNRTHVLKAGDSALYLPGSMFTLSTREKPRIGFAIFNAHLGFKCDKEEVIIVRGDEEVKTMGNVIHRALRVPSRFQWSIIDSASTCFAAMIYSRIDESMSLTNKDAAYWVEFGKNLIETSYEENLELQELFSDIPYSYEHFSRMFKELTGMTPSSHRIGRRLDRAKQLLIRSDLSITDIAHMLGFASSQHFAATMKKREGKTPSEVRRMNRSINKAF